MKIGILIGILFAVLAGSVFLFNDEPSLAEHLASAETANWADHVLLSQIKISGSGGTTDEFIELYNPTSLPIDISSWSIKKFTKTSTSSEQSIEIVDLPNESIIKGYGFFLIAHNNFQSVVGVSADVQYSPEDSSFTLTDNNTVVLIDPSGNIIDMVGYGEATAFEGTAGSIAPTQSQSIMRKIGGEYGNGIDSDSNVDDWFRTAMNPRNQTSETLGPPVSSHNPVAVFVASKDGEDNEFFVNEEILFDASSSNDSLDGGAIVQYHWSFGDGTTSTIETATTTHIYTATGEYTVQLTVIDDLGESGDVQTEILILDPADFPEDSVEEVGDEENNDDDEEPGQANQTVLVINEFVSEPASGEKEWIELYNNSSSSFDLAQFTLWDGAGKIASPTGTIESGGFAVIELSSSKLNNTGDRIILKSLADEIIDQVTFGSWDDDNLSDNAKRPTSPNSVARKVDGQDTDVDATDFAETTTPTKGVSNIISAPVVPPPSSSGGGGGGGGSGSGGTQSPTIGSSSGNVVINEIVADPAEDQDEFVELYNKGTETIDLTGWWLEDGSKAKTLLTGVLPAGSFLAIDNPKGKLNNSGDMITIFSPSGATVDWVAYGSWLSGEYPTAPKKGKSLSLKKDGATTGKQSIDFVETSTITKGSANVLTDIININNNSTSTESLSTQTGNLIITEILPNPTKVSGWDEFVEIFNNGNTTISLKGWKIKDASKKVYTIGNIVIQPQQYFAFYKKETGIALNNTGSETVILIDFAGANVDTVSYTGNIPKDQSYSKESGGWKWTTTPTPGKVNEVSENQPPFAVIDFDDEVPVGMEVVFDASRSTDPEQGSLVVEWKIEEKNKKGLLVKHTFAKVGVYPVSVTLTDAVGSKVQQELIVTVKGKESFVGGPVLDEATDAIGLRIEEIYPYPATGEEEFIELFHGGLFPINLSLYQLDDAVGGSRPYKIGKETIIEPGQYLVFSGAETGLTLNNTSDSVRLLSPVGTVLQEVSYVSTVKQASYSNIKGDWQWTSSVTPEKENVSQPLSSAKSNTSASTKKVSSATSVKKTSTSNKVKPIYELSLSNLRTRIVGDQVLTEGIVSVLPGVYGAQYFYIVDAVGQKTEVDSGVQVYLYSKEFPEMKVGDRVRVGGELMKTNGELRIKANSGADIQIVHSESLPSPKELEIADIAEPYEGWLIKVAGEVTEAKSTHIYVDDGSEEIKAYFKQGAKINPKQFRVGDTVEVTGIVNRTKTGYQLLPRSMEDLMKIAEAEKPDTFVVAGTVGTAAATAKMYLTTTAAGITSVLVGLAARARGAMALVFLRRLSGVALSVVRKFRG